MVEIEHRNVGVGARFSPLMEPYILPLNFKVKALTLFGLVLNNGFFFFQQRLRWFVDFILLGH